MGQVLPFCEAERLQARKLELCKPVSLPIRTLGTIILVLYVPYVLFKVGFTN